MKIGHIIDKINDNQLFVPEFQREYVWKRDDAKRLFESLICKYPTGSLLTWETTNPPEVKGPIKYKPEMGAVKLILDGQQRITTIYMILEGKLPPYYQQHEIQNDILDLHVNIEDLKLEYFKQQKMQDDPKWVKLTSIYQGIVKSSDLRKQLREKGLLNDVLEDTIDNNFENLKAIKDIDFPEQIIPIKAEIEVAINIFYIVNSSGVSLTDAELALAQICGYWPEARELFKQKLQQLEKKGYLFKLDFIVYALLAVVYSSGSEMRKLHGKENKDKIMEAWQHLDTRVLDVVTDLLREHAFIEHSAEINSPYGLMPIILYTYMKNNQSLSSKEKKKATQWYFYSQIRQRYTTSLQQKLDRDLGIVKTSQKPFEELMGAIQRDRALDITENELIGRNWQHPIFSLMKSYFKSQKAKCLNSGKPLFGLVEKKYSLAKQQIFPYSSLKNYGYEKDNKLKYALVNEMTNFTFVLDVANFANDKEEVADFLRRADEITDSGLSLQCIPKDEELWDTERFEDFLNERRSMLVKELNNFLKTLTKIEIQHGELEISDLTDSYETDKLEFKSSLRWDRGTNQVNKELELSVAKTIAAFNNGYREGGLLLIGVDDNQNVEGLEDDFKTFENCSQDEFERHLRQIFTNHFGHSFVARLEIEFHRIWGRAVCAVKVERGQEPLFLKKKNKAGELVKAFYYRNGNMSVPIVGESDVSSYIKNRFDP